MTTCIDINNSGTENQPLHENQEQTTQDVQEAPVDTDVEHVAMSLLEHHENESKGPSNMKSFNIEPAYQNTIENPYKETTVTLPHLVKKMPEEQLLPRPWRTFNQVVCLSYISILFCMCIGVFANRYAWRAKLQNGKGLYGLAQKWSRRAVYASYTAFVVGLIIIIIVPLTATNTI
ncbi:hypothetical protein KP79_PYT07669 [Mizuhopecten yessoensis]|uniref:Uncharacterized protein n=2 Tax=Mizuhopecten yessoensis TaxID=6573 RepID=A0A210QY56_MIZYE|nr:hypothetical protein KP79_PYT07669 [Mizuhopecten yessoensis]